MALTFGGSSVTMTPAVAQAWGIQSVPQTTSTYGSSLGGSGGASGGGSSFAGNLGIGVSVGQAIGAAVGAFISAKASSYVLEKQAEMLKMNEERMQMGYESALRAGESQISKVTREAGQIKARQRNSLAANGVSLGVGSAAELTTSTNVNKALDVKNIQENALANAWGYSTKATQYRIAATASQMGASYANDTAVSSTISKGLESIGNVADKWYMYNYSK